MNAQDWNRDFPPGTQVLLTLANGEHVTTRTKSQAEHWGGLDHIQVEAIERGYVLLSWVQALAPPLSARRQTGQSGRP